MDGEHCHYSVATPVFAARAAQEGNKLVYKAAGQTIVIQAWGRDSLRVRVTPDGGGQTSDWALDIPLEKEAKIEIAPNEASLRNGKISVRIHDTPIGSGRMQFFRHSGDKQIPILGECDHAVDANHPGARTFKPAGDGLFSSELQFAARDGERLYGMGENAVNAPNKVNLKGCTIDLFQRHMKAVVPLVVSSEGYGFLWNNPSLGRVEFGKDRTRWISYRQQSNSTTSSPPAIPMPTSWRTTPMPPGTPRSFPTGPPDSGSASFATRPRSSS